MNKSKCVLNILEENEYINVGKGFYLADDDSSLHYKYISSKIGDDGGLKFIKKLAEKYEQSNEYIMYGKSSKKFNIISKKEIDEFLNNLKKEETFIDKSHWSIRDYINEKKDFEIKEGVVRKDVIYNKKIMNERVEKENKIEQDAIELLEKIW